MLPRTHRTLLTAKQAHLSVAQRSRLDHILAADVELAVVWAIKEITVQLLATRTGADFEAQWQKLDVAVRASDLPEPAALFKTLIGVEGRDPHVLSHTGHQRQNQGSQLNAKNIKRAGRATSTTTTPGPVPARRDRQERGVNTPTTLKSRRAAMRRL